MAQTFSFGIEEELFLADARTRGTPERTKPFHDAVHARLPEVERELLVSQVEIMTPPCTATADARDCLSGLRNSLAEIGREHGLLVFGGGSHPAASWRRQERTRKERYDEIADDMQMLASRDVVSGMHVHVEVPNPADRVDLMERVLPHVPTFLALSASSPFWQGRRTGLNAYRLSVWGEMPRTGLPELFAEATEYERFVAAMVKAGAIADASYLWWMLRPSTPFPTLELRVCDSCTRLEDTLAIAALYRCLVRRLVLRPDGREPTAVSRAIAAENIWRAQRRGTQAEFIGEDGAVTPFADHVAALLGSVAEDADALGCAVDLAHVGTIVADGTSADWQLAVFEEMTGKGATASAAMRGVVDWMADATAPR